MKTTGMTKAQITEHSRSLQRALNAKCDELDRLRASSPAPAMASVTQELPTIEARVTCDVDGDVVINPFAYIKTPGDFDGDGDVDGADFLMWQEGYAKGEYDGLDFLTFQVAYPKAPLEIATFGTKSEHVVLKWEIPWVDRFVTVTPATGFLGEAVVLFVLSNLTGTRREVVRVTVTVTP